MDISVWGPAMWQSMHSISFAYPEQPSHHEQAAAFSFLQSLCTLLPCPQCRMHYAAYLKSTIPSTMAGPLKSKQGLVKWTIDLHNDVNERLGKPIMPYEEVHRRFGDASTVCRAGTSSTSPAMHWMPLVVALVVATVALVVTERHRAKVCPA